MSDANAFTFDVRVTMESDWAIGSGAGRQGSIDRLIERDSDGLPCIPAKTLRGMWRDAAEQLAFGLDDGGGRKNGWTALVPHLFGSQPAIDQRGQRGEPPARSRLSVGDAVFGEKERKFLAHEISQPLRDALTFVRPGVAIDVASGTARPDFLRFEEFARQGITLVAPCSIALREGPRANAAVALAIGALALVERIGGKRRRGAGRCRMTAVNIKGPAGTPTSFEEALKILDGPVPAASPEREQVGPTIPYTASRREEQPESHADSAWSRWTVEIALIEPVVVPDAVLGNVITTLDHLPGTMLMPVLASALAGSGMDERAVWAGFANGDIRALPAYPRVGGGRSWPIPSVWERKKDDTEGPDGGGRLRNSLIDRDEPDPCTPVDHRSLQADETSSDQYKPMRDGFFGQVDAGPAVSEIAPVFAEIKTVVRTHNAVDDLRQKPTTEAGGGLYSYEALAPGQVFVGELWIRGVPTAVFDTKSLEKPVPAKIGRAKTGGYGKAEVTITKATSDLATPPVLGDELFLFVASDIVLRFDEHRSAIDMLCNAIKQEYRIALDRTHVNGDLRFRRHEGWVAHWNLPRPSLVAIKAGSALKLRIEPGVDDLATKLNNLQENGLGERRGEGFGHVLVNNSVVTSKVENAPREREKKDGGQERPSLGTVSAELAELLELIEVQAAKDAIRLLAAGHAPSLPRAFGWSADKPTMSQLGALRAVIGDLAEAWQLEAGQRYLEARKDAEAWANELFEVFKRPSRVWEQLQTSNGPAQQQSSDQEAKRSRPDSLFDFARDPQALAASEPLQRYALASLFHAAMRAHKRALEKQRRMEDRRAASERAAAAAEGA